MQAYQVLAYGQSKSIKNGYAVISTEEIMEKLELSRRQVERVFSRMTSKGEIKKISKGIYLVPGTLPPGKKWRPFWSEVLPIYMEAIKANYQVTGLECFNRYGFSTQIPQKVTVYNTKIYGTRTIAGNTFIFIKVPQKLLGNFTDIAAPTVGRSYNFPTKGRTLFDAINGYVKFGTLPDAYEWIKDVVKEKETIEELLDCAIKYGNISSQRRVGFILEKLGVQNPKITRLQKKSVRSKTMCSLNPDGRSGEINRDWGIIENFQPAKYREMT